MRDYKKEYVELQNDRSSTNIDLGEKEKCVYVF